MDITQTQPTVYLSADTNSLSNNFLNALQSTDGISLNLISSDYSWAIKDNSGTLLLVDLFSGLDDSESWVPVLVAPNIFYMRNLMTGNFIQENLTTGNIPVGITIAYI